MTVNRLSKTSPLIQADSITISVFSRSSSHFTTISTSQSNSRSQRSNSHYFILIVGITIQITKINHFCSIPEMIQAIIHPNSKLRFSLGHEIAKNCEQKQSILKRGFRSKSGQKTKLNNQNKA